MACSGPHVGTAIGELMRKEPLQLLSCVLRGPNQSPDTLFCAVGGLRVVCRALVEAAGEQLAAFARPRDALEGLAGLSWQLNHYRCRRSTALRLGFSLT